MKNLFNIINELTPEMVEIRHRLHSFPELGNQEFNTAKIVADTLTKYGYFPVKNIGTTGVSAIFDTGISGKTVALRADMDALPLKEETELPYRSKNEGIMHACGHDGHTATLLLVAAALKKIVPDFPGKIKFIFQPAEEIGTGANDMIQAGILAEPTVDAIFGYHNSGRGPIGTVMVKQGCLLGGECSFTIKITGRGGHAAHVGSFVDPIYIASLVVQATQGIISRYTTPQEPLVISITQFHAGTTFNVIPNDATLNGTIRVISSNTLRTVKSQLENICHGIAKSFSAKAEIFFEQEFPPTVNHAKETKLLINTASRILGDENIIIMEEPSMGSEDFAFFLEKVPGCFFFVGTGSETILHTSQYQFNDKILPIAAHVMIEIASEYLR